jgi:hypothetical protein
MSENNRGPIGIAEERSRLERLRREESLDRTLGDSFPSSDPPSSIPDPVADEPYAA